MSGRSYLSIGDVLTLLRQEFPDVTISKIRFLESQGLVNPERTPSGYRKFYEQDVERLRWVLRQQREHFLPLKVIKGRLEQEGVDGLDDDTFDADVDGFDADVDADVGTVAFDAETDPFDADTGDADTGDADTDLGETAVEEVAVIRDRSEGAELRRRPVPVLVGQGAPSVAPSGSRSASGTALPGFEGQSRPSGHVGTAEMAAATFADGGSASGAEEPAPPPSVPAAAGSRRAASRPAGTRGASKAPSAAPVPAAKAREVAAAGIEPAISTMSGNDMTIEELASAAGLTVGDVQQLESFGLVSGRLVGGVMYFDEDCLAIARTAAGFARYGVEARHLRLHKHAAEREAGFIEQIVLPLLKQRNPESRQRAHDNVTELTRLGQQLRSVLLRNTLRDQLGG
ncbi:MAG TPA: MerR family transcriptional regulator [Acidimicrobiales bacterium]|jgi:DNA-binding transcriptional MerR regulator